MRFREKYKCHVKDRLVALNRGGKTLKAARGERHMGREETKYYKPRKTKPIYLSLDIITIGLYNWFGVTYIAIKLRCPSRVTGTQGLHLIKYTARINQSVFSQFGKALMI